MDEERLTCSTTDGLPEQHGHLGDGTAYDDGLDDVDLWIGGLAEKNMPFGGMLGSTFNFVFEIADGEPAERRPLLLPGRASPA